MENYELAKEKVETTNRSYRAIAKEHKTSHTTLQNVAKKDGWSISHRVSKNSNVSIEKKPPKAAHEKILGRVALRKIDEIVLELGDKYSPIDEPLIALYAKNYQRWIELEAEINKEGILSTSSKGIEYMSPKFTASLAVQKSLVTIAQQLGLSIAARKRLGLKFERPGQKQDSIFEVIASINETSDDEVMNDI